MKKQLLLLLLMVPCSLFSAKKNTITCANAVGRLEVLSGQMETMFSEEKVLAEKNKGFANGVAYVQLAVKIVMEHIKKLDIKKEESDAIDEKFGQNGQKIESKFTGLVTKACGFLLENCDKSSAAHLFVQKMIDNIPTIARHIKKLICEIGDCPALPFESLPVGNFLWSVRPKGDEALYLNTNSKTCVFLDQKISELKKGLFSTQRGQALREKVEEQTREEQAPVDNKSTQPTCCARIALGIMGVLGIMFAVGEIAWILNGK